MKIKAKARHLLALWFGISSLSMAHPFFEPCQWSNLKIWTECHLMSNWEQRRGIWKEWSNERGSLLACFRPLSLLVPKSFLLPFKRYFPTGIILINHFEWGASEIKNVGKEGICKICESNFFSLYISSLFLAALWQESPSPKRRKKF